MAIDPDLLAQMAKEAGITYDPKKGLSEEDKPAIPDVTENDLGVIAIVWDDGEVKLQVMLEDLMMDRRELTCLFSAHVEKGGRWTWVIEPGRINLLSFSTKIGYIRELEKRTQRDWSWRMSQVVVVATKHLTSQNAPVNLHEVKYQDEESSWLAKPLLERGEHTVLAAEGGTGKSMLAMAIAVSVGLGRSIVPEVTVTYEQSVNSLYLDWEDDADTHARRMKALCTGWGFEHVPNTIKHQRMVGPLANQLRDVRQVVAANKIGLVIVDSAGLAVGGDINDAAVALRYMSNIRALGSDLTVLTLTHLAKENKGSPIGSVFFREGPRSMWLAVNEQDEGSAESYIGLFHKKVNNKGKMKAIGLRAEFEDGATRYYKQGLDVFTKISAHLSLTERIYSILANGKITVDDLCDQIPDEHRKEIVSALNRMKAQGKIARFGDEIGLASRQGDEL